MSSEGIKSVELLQIKTPLGCAHFWVGLIPPIISPRKMRTAAKVGCSLAAGVLLVAVLAVLVILLVAVFTPHRCFLDVLNAQISKRCKFSPFYAASDQRWGLPAPNEVVPGLAALDQNYETIRGEMMAAIFGAQPAGDQVSTPMHLPPMHEVYNNIFMYKGSEAPRTGPMQSLSRRFSSLIYGKDTDIFDKIGSQDWRTYNLMLFHHPVPGNAERCPRTLELLQSVPGIQSALFSVIAPGAYIPPHSDPAKGVIRYHLALRVPKPVRRADGSEERRCYIEVDCDHGRGCPKSDESHRYRWEEGKSVVFDDVFPHWVVNDTDEIRVILFVDILRPDMKGGARVLQEMANMANYYHPGVRRLIRASKV